MRNHLDDGDNALDAFAKLIKIIVVATVAILIALGVWWHILP